MAPSPSWQTKQGFGLGVNINVGVNPKLFNSQKKHSCSHHSQTLELSYAQPTAAAEANKVHLLGSPNDKRALATRACCPVWQWQCSV